jgi:predicted DNA-binding WGR domain protein
MNVRFGKIGANGQTTVKEFSSTDEANKAAEKLIAEKTKKGYLEK